MAQALATSPAVPPGPPQRAQITPMTRDEAEQARLREQLESRPRPYEDRYLSSGDDTLQSADGDPTHAHQEPAEGMRSWLVESRINHGSRNSSESVRRHGIGLGARLEHRRETRNHGTLSLLYDGRTRRGSHGTAGGNWASSGYAAVPSSSRFRLSTQGLPLTPTLLSDIAVGDLYSEVTTGLQRQRRLSLGTTTIRGMGARVYSPGLDVRAGLGQRGVLTGGPYPGFEKSEGTLAWFGASRQLDPHWTAAIQVDQAKDISGWDLDLSDTQGVGRKRITSWAVAVNRGTDLLRDGEWRMRTTLLGSQVRAEHPDTSSASSSGLFIEASLRHGRYRHEAGIHATRPNLHFGDAPLAAGSRGVYWQLSRDRQRLNWALGIDMERVETETLSLQTAQRRVGLNGSFMHALGRHSAWGARFTRYDTQYQTRDVTAPWHGDTVSMATTTSQNSRSRSRSQSAQLFYRTKFLGWPRTHFSLTLRRNDLIVLNSEAATGQEMQWEQTWLENWQNQSRVELSTTLGHARDRSSGAKRHYPTAGVHWRYWPDSRFGLTGSLRYTSQRGGLHTSRGLSGSISAERDLGRGWRAGLSATLHEARLATTRTTAWSPPIYRSNDRGVFVYLRWEGAAGRPYAAIGTRDAGAGSGRVMGRVFLDLNRDGEAQLDEVGVPGVEVVLDGRHRTITDGEGRFEFPWVSTGPHELSLRPESVPLPWGPSPEAARVNVPLRGQADIAIPVTRMTP